MTVITLSKASHGWQGIFRGSATMPNDVPLPLPFTHEAPTEMVKTDLRSRFADASFVVKANSRDIAA